MLNIKLTYEDLYNTNKDIDSIKKVKKTKDM